MIKANELRIGNWIKSDEKFIQVDANIISVIAQLEKEFKDLNFPNGIPLTPEILEKAGFEYNEDTRYELKLFNGFTLNTIHSKNNVLNLFKDDGYNSGFGNIEYLHQLQNLYYALAAGEELEIQL